MATTGKPVDIASSQDAWQRLPEARKHEDVGAPHHLSDAVTLDAAVKAHAGRDPVLAGSALEVIAQLPVADDVETGGRVAVEEPGHRVDEHSVPFDRGQVADGEQPDLVGGLVASPARTDSCPPDWGRA